jgi:hypothetical protein
MLKLNSLSEEKERIYKNKYLKRKQLQALGCGSALFWEAESESAFECKVRVALTKMHLYLHLHLHLHCRGAGSGSGSESALN